MKMRIIDIMFRVPPKTGEILGEGILVTEDGNCWEMELDTQTTNLQLNQFIPSDKTQEYIDRYKK